MRRVVTGPRILVPAIGLLLGVAIGLASFQLGRSGAVSESPRVEGDVICDVTLPNGDVSSVVSFGNHGNEALTTSLPPNGTTIFHPDRPGRVMEDGTVLLVRKFRWWRHLDGTLTFEGRRLDGDAAPLRAEVPSGYGSTGFQATALIFPSAGCWEVTARVADATLTFVTHIVKVGDGPRRIPG